MTIDLDGICRSHQDGRRMNRGGIVAGQCSAIQGLRCLGCGMEPSLFVGSSFVVAGRPDQPVGLGVTRARVWGSFSGLSTS